MSHPIKVIHITCTNEECESEFPILWTDYCNNLHAECPECGKSGPAKDFDITVHS